MVRTFSYIRKSSFKLAKKVLNMSGRHNENSSPPAAAADSSPSASSSSPGGSKSKKSPTFSNGSSSSPSGVAAAAPPPPAAKSAGDQKPSGPPSDMELMKEKFAKLLLGEDMSGGGKGVSSALALSNAITNLAASIFGEQRKLEPMNPERRARWRKECDWLLSVTDYIVELVPSQQTLPNGMVMEVMASRQRSDLLVNVPALRKLDNMLIDCLDNFRGQNEFWYPKNLDETEKNKQRDWWIPTVKVPENGLSDATRKWIQHQKDAVNQVLKAALAINAQILSEMEIPESYIESLPKNGRATLGDSIYKSITDEYFDPEQFLETLDLTSEHKVVELKDKIEASVVIWRRKMVQKDSKSAWGSAVSIEKREIFEDRAETILLILKHQFPGIPQSSLDISKIQDNVDVGHSVLESYSRVLESLASAVMNRIDDVLAADTAAREAAGITDEISLDGDDEMINGGGSMTLLDFMGWDNLEPQPDDDNNTKKLDDDVENNDDEVVTKTPTVPEAKKLSYLERLENWGGLRSEADRH